MRTAASKRARQPLKINAAEKLRAGDELRREMLALHPDWPTEEQRREDPATHIRVSEMLQSVKLPRR